VYIAVNVVSSFFCNMLGEMRFPLLLLLSLQLSV